MSNTVPEGWERKLLKDAVSTVIAGQSPNRKDHPAKAGKYGILKTTAIDWGKYSPDKNQEVLDDFKVNPKHEVKTGDILITKAGPVHRVGVVTYVPETPEKMLVSGKMTLLRTGSLHDSRFLAYALATEYSQKPLKESTTGMALSQTNFTHETLLDVPFWVPQVLPEQQKIAAILSSVDDVIEKTRAQIDKLKDLKTGMMQELLTKGIGHTEFKDSPVGRIPTEWNVKTLGEVFALTSGSTPSRGHASYFSSSASAHPWVKTMDLNGSTVSVTDEKITDKALNESACKLLPPGTALIAMYGGWNQIGRSGVLGIRAATNQAICALVSKGLVDGYYANYWLIAMRPIWKSIAASSRKDPNITKQDVSDFLIAVPPAAEQQRIVEKLNTFTDLIENKHVQLANYRNLKKALMQDLLTGKVRVKVDQKESAVA